MLDEIKHYFKGTSTYTKAFDFICCTIIIGLCYLVIVGLASVNPGYGN